MSPCTKRANTGKRCEDGNRRSHDNSRSWTKFFSCARKNAIRWLANIYGKHETTRLPCSSNHTHIAQKQFVVTATSIADAVQSFRFNAFAIWFSSNFRFFNFSICLFRVLCCAALFCSVLFCLPEKGQNKEWNELVTGFAINRAVDVGKIVLYNVHLHKV